MKNPHTPKKILVVRNDKLGDFMLAWPSFAALKHAFPEARVVALVPNYTRPIAELCPWIDEILIDPTEQAGAKGFWALLKQFRAQRFDLMVTLFSTSRIGLLGMLAGIQTRWAPATKLAQIFYNHTLKQKRSRSEKTEYQYNLDLAQAAIEAQGCTCSDTSAPYLPIDAEKRAVLRQQFIAENDIDPSKQLIFIHAGHGGSANNLSLDQYADLARRINAEDHCFILTAGPGELEDTQKLGQKVAEYELDFRVFNSTGGLQSFAHHLSLADLFIAGSTGTLHIAGALDRPTVGFYPNRRSSTPLRWRTLNSEGRYLALTPPSEVEQDMSRVDLEQAADAIRSFFSDLK